MVYQELENQIRATGLKVTPQRVAVLNQLTNGTHPTAENLIEKIKDQHASISSGTIYHILDVFVERELIQRVYTRKGVMRYDAVMDPHHHLYDEETGIIEDYFDDELFVLIKDYLKTKPIDNFDMKDVKLKLIGNFNK